MVSLRQAAVEHKGKKELYDLPKLEVDKIELKQDKFNKDGKEIPFTYLEIDGWKYTISSGLMTQIKYLLEHKPSTKFIRFMRSHDGKKFVIDVE